MDGHISLYCCDTGNQPIYDGYRKKNNNKGQSHEFYQLVKICVN
jgi:hypothetical protein